MSLPFGCERRFPLASLMLLLAVAWPSRTPGQQPPTDRIIMKSGEQQVGRVLGVSNNAVQLQIVSGTASGVVPFPLANISRVDAAPPAGFQAGVAAYQQGNYDRALSLIKPLVDTFGGLPADWARQAGALLGDIYIEKNDLVRAEAAYNAYHTQYGAGGGLRVNVGMARIAVAKNDDARAKQILAPIAAAALKDPIRVTRLDSAAYGVAFTVLGQISEKAGDYPAALEDYLRTVTLFYQDPVAVTAAQKKADALRGAHPGVTAP